MLPPSIEIFSELTKFDGVKFFDRGHRYMLNGRPRLSTTGFVHKFEPQFDVDTAAPRYAEKHGLDEAEVRKLWLYKNHHGVFEGSTLHNYAEGYIANKVVEPDTANEHGTVDYKEIAETVEIMRTQFRNFHKDFVASGRLIPIRSELVVGSDSLDICGMVDQLFWSVKQQCLVVFDWKTNTKMDYSNQYQRMLGPLSHMDKCEISTYSLQLEIYRRIIETETSLRLPIGGVVVWFNEGNPDYQLVQLRNVRAEVEAMFAYRQDHPDEFSLAA